MHAYHQRRLDDLPIGGRAVVVQLRVPRLVSAVWSCPRWTFREQIPALTQRWARRTQQLTALVADLAVVVAGRARAAVLPRVGARVSRNTVLRVLMATLLLPDVAVPAVLSVDDFAMRRGRRYATLLINVVTHRRVDVLPDRKAATSAVWLREHPGVQVMCRDGSAGYAESIRTGAPQAVQVSDRWHPGKAVEETVIADSGCCVTAQLECARRLGWALNTVKRYARAASAEKLKPRYRETLVDPFRDHLRRRRAEEPGVAVTRLLAEIRELGYTREPAGPLPEPRPCGRDPHTTLATTAGHVTRPADLPALHQQHVDNLLGSCGHLAVLTERVRQSAGLLIGRRGEDLDTWMTRIDADDLPALHGFVHSLRMDLSAVVAVLTLPIATARSKVPTPTSNSSSDRCVAAPASTCYAKRSGGAG